MNDVIRKCVDELSKEEPRLDYVRGMLDTLLSMNAPVKTVSRNQPQEISTVQTSSTMETPIVDEAMLMEARVAAIRKNLPPVEME